MSLIATYSVSTASSITLSGAYSTIDEVLIQIPDNTGNEIDASDVRDAVYSLWYRIDGLSASVAGLTISNEFVGLTPSTITSPIGGIQPGATFSGTIQDVLNEMLYPYVVPSASLDSLSNREFGNVGLVSVSWTATEGSNNMTSIIVGGVSQTITGSSSQTGAQLLTLTHSASPVGASESQSFTMSVSDGINTVTATTSLYWMNRIYWGTVNVPSYPNLTTNPGSASLVAAVCTDGAILALDGADANGLAYGNELSSTKNKTYLGIDGSYSSPGEYLVFAWPSTVSGALTPKFMVNGMINTAFTRVRTASPFVNTYGFTTNYEVWVSNTRYFSPVDIIIS